MKTAVLVLLGSLLLASSGASADPRVYHTTRAERPPLIDGRLDDASWTLVEWAGDFLQRDPAEGEPPSAETTFKILYDDENLYVGVRALDDEPNEIGNILARRDHFPGDWVEINIDSLNDHRTAFSFTASVSGTQGDEFISEDGSSWDSNWDPVWEHQAQVDGDGWTAELRIPLSQLRYGDQEEQVWGIQVQRRIYRHEERSCWQPIPKDEPGWVSRFGELRGIRGIRAQRQVELLPYGVTRGETFEEEAGNPFADGTRGKLSGGLDGKIGITGDLVVDFTLNPDFGQVEADPSQVNLSAFETFFGERRPFFIEGSNILDFRVAPSVAFGTHTQDRLFYSRRIGRRPHYRADWYEDGFVDMPENSSIVGAAKLTGKTQSGLSIAVLESVTSEERADIDLDGVRSEKTVEPLSNYFVGRLQKDYRRGDTRIGTIFTAVNRDIETPELLFLHDAAYTGGLDFFHYLAGRRYYLAVKAVGSRVEGDPEAILRTQRSSARYYQRPDNKGQSVDSTLTALSGHGGSARFGSREGAVNYDVGVAWRSPGFELNDLGFLRRSDEINQFGWISYNWRQPFSVFRSMSVNFNQWLDWEYAGENTYQAANVNGWANFTNNWSTNVSLTRENEKVSLFTLRGGPSMTLPGGIDGNVNFNSDHRKALSGGAGGWGRVSDDGGGDALSAWVWLAWRPNNAVRMELNPEWSRSDSKLQYVTTASVDDDPRYVFAAIDQRTFNLSFRVDYSLTPRLTLQYYGSPFVSAGDYSAFKRITEPRADAYEDRFAGLDGTIEYDEADDEYGVDEDGDDAEDYSFSDPDFNFRDFNSNLVLRWEYSPGSSLYLVWSQSRSGFVPTGEFNLGSDLDGLFSEHPRNVFLLKVNRWISL